MGDDRIYFSFSFSPIYGAGWILGDFYLLSKIIIMSDIRESIPTAAEAKKETRRRWRFQYSLRTLLIFVSIVGVLCGWLGIFLQRVHDQSQRCGTNRRLWAGMFVYDYQMSADKSNCRSSTWSQNNPLDFWR